MWLLKSIIVSTLLIHKSSAAERPDIYLTNIKFIVGIFENNPEITDRDVYLHQGVLIHRQLVLTSSDNFYKNIELKVRAYNWPSRIRLYNDQKTSPSNYEERRVDTIEYNDDETSRILILVLIQPFENINNIVNDDFTPENFYHTDSNKKCVFIKLKFTENRCTKFACDSKVRVKQRKIKPNTQLSSYKCDLDIIRKIFKVNRINDNNFYCAHQTGRFKCHNYPGAALACESTQRGQYFLAGINTANNNCNFIFENTQRLNDWVNKILKDIMFEIGY
ncbi:uncharacterized protein LOC130672176 [Microplitis mediator]|uniref:uncharacterized protein LOC130672176 n=1 Tax=Microplitis mediator TaxID=375433 RepID=UPI002555D356|nr:uncharacterized protein LOC130672176 [Microplitis mediator]